tara:strand:+ start:723 stop:1388 length:666 start_codon:yes stop_codon:yes gene_type:complete
VTRLGAGFSDVVILSDGEVCLNVPSQFVRPALSKPISSMKIELDDDAFFHAGFLDLKFVRGRAAAVGAVKLWGATTSLQHDFAPSLQNHTSMQPTAIYPQPRAADTYGCLVFPKVEYSGGPMLEGDKGELKRGADELVVHYFEFTEDNGVVRRAYATGSLDGDVVKANRLLSLRELKSAEYLSRLSPELRALVQKARRAPRPAANPVVPTALPPHPSAPVK